MKRFVFTSPGTQTSPDSPDDTRGVISVRRMLKIGNSCRAELISVIRGGGGGAFQPTPDARLTPY